MVSKVSQITTKDVADFIRAGNDEEDNLQTYLTVAKDFVSNYTGIPVTSTEPKVDTLDTYSDFVIAVLVLCQDMYDNRTLYVDTDKLNRLVETILNLHSRNLL